MTDDESLAKHSVQALRTAAEVLGVNPLSLAKRLQDGELGRLMQLLNAALPYVPAAGLRHRIEDLLSSVTDGQMPMFEKPETEFDWAMETLRQRRREAQRDAASSEADTAEDGRAEADTAEDDRAEDHSES